MNSTDSPLSRASAFSERFGLRMPIIMAPMAGACPPALARAVAQAGGMGANGALLDGPDQIAAWMQAFRAGDSAQLPVQINTWIPDPPPERNATHEAAVCEFLAQWGPPVTAEVYRPAAGLDFDNQVEAMIQARPTVISSIMGLYERPLVARFKEQGIAWFACATTVTEARAAEQAGADVIVAQGAEAGGHRGVFHAPDGVDRAAGLLALLPQIVDAVSVPVVATGGIADGRAVAAALILGASAVQVGTGLLRADESSIAPAWRDAIASTEPDATRLTRAFSGRWGRAIASDYVVAANGAESPDPAPYPVQRSLTGAMRKQATENDDIRTLQAWCGQSAAQARIGPAGDIVAGLWQQARDLLR